MTDKIIRCTCDAKAGVAYVYLPDYPGSDASAVYGAVSRTIDLADLIENYKGPWVNLNFDASGVLVGIEVVGRSTYTDEELNAME